MLVDKGLDLAETTVGLMQDLQPGHEFFDQISFMDSESLPEYQLLIKRAKSTDIAELDANDRTKLIEMTFTYIEPQHRMGLVDDNFRQQVLKARRLFQEKLPVDLQDAISFYNPETYNAAASVQDNLLMGRIVYGRARGPQRVQEAVSNLLADMDLKEALVDIGLEYDIGSGGKRLTKVQRQKLGVARALIKQPDLLILNRALSSLDAQQQADIVKDILAFLEKQQTSPAIICVAAQTAVTSLFEHVYLFSGSSLVESGRHEELANSGGEFAQLMAR